MFYIIKVFGKFNIQYFLEEFFLKFLLILHSKLENLQKVSYSASISIETYLIFFDLTLAHKIQLNTNNTDKTTSENTLVNLFTLILQMIAENKIEFRVQEKITAAVVRCSGEDNC